MGIEREGEREQRIEKEGNGSYREREAEGNRRKGDREEGKRGQSVFEKDKVREQERIQKGNRER